MQEIMKLTALQLGAAIRRGEVSPTEAVKAALERIEETAGDNAFTEITAERALERAAWAEKELAADREFWQASEYQPNLLHKFLTVQSVLQSTDNTLYRALP